MKKINVIACQLLQVTLGDGRLKKSHEPANKLLWLQDTRDKL